MTEGCFQAQALSFSYILSVIHYILPGSFIDNTILQ